MAILQKEKEKKLTRERELPSKGEQKALEKVTKMRKTNKRKTTITKRASSSTIANSKIFGDDLQEVKKKRRNKFANIVNNYRFICSFDLYG